MAPRRVARSRTCTALVKCPNDGYIICILAKPPDRSDEDRVLDASLKYLRTFNAKSQREPVSAYSTNLDGP